MYMCVYTYIYIYIHTHLSLLSWLERLFELLHLLELDFFSTGASFSKRADRKALRGLMCATTYIVRLMLQPPIFEAENRQGLETP